MIRNRRTFFRHIAAALVLSAAALGTSPARADAGFQNWINEFYATAAKAGERLVAEKTGEGYVEK